MSWFRRQPPMKAQVMELEQKVERMKGALIQARVEMMELDGGSLTWNLIKNAKLYTSRSYLVKAIMDKFDGIDPVGSELVKRIVKTRSAFVWSGGIDTHDDQGEDKEPLEQTYLDAFIKHNDLDGAWGQDLGIEKEVEGQLLFMLSWVSDPEDKDFGGHVSLSCIPHQSKPYKVKWENDDPSSNHAISVSWKEGNGEENTLAEGQFEFFRFNCRLASKEGWPDLAGVLHVVDAFSQNLRHWDSINYLYSHPTPYFKTKDRQEAKELMDHMTSQEVNWKIGKMFAGPAEFTLVSNAGDWLSIQGLLQACIRIISANTGVPVQFLGYADIMSNRATAENTMEPVAVVALSEQIRWTSGFQHIFDKAIDLYNANAQGKVKLFKGRVSPKMPFVTAQHLALLETLWLPSYQAGAISLDTYLGMLPGIVASVEKEKLKAEEGERAKKREAALGALAERIGGQTPPPQPNGAQPPPPATTGGKAGQAGGQ